MSKGWGWKRWGLLHPQSRAGAGRCSSDVWKPTHPALRVPEGSLGAFWILSSKDALPSTRIFWSKTKTETKPPPPGSPTAHRAAVLSGFPTSEGSEEWESLRFHFLCLLKINMLRSCLLVSLSSPKRHTASVNSALTEATSTIYKASGTNLVKGRFPLHWSKPVLAQWWAAGPSAQRQGSRQAGRCPQPTLLGTWQGLLPGKLGSHLFLGWHNKVHFTLSQFNQYFSCFGNSGHLREQSSDTQWSSLKF